jgi:hypothetical protein
MTNIHTFRHNKLTSHPLISPRQNKHAKRTTDHKTPRRHKNGISRHISRKNSLRKICIISQVNPREKSASKCGKSGRREMDRKSSMNSVFVQILGNQIKT